MSEKGGVGSAFPHDHNESFGMTLRDYFAAHALVGIFGNVDTFQVDAEARRLGVDNQHILAQYAFQCADAMLKERSK